MVMPPEELAHACLPLSYASSAGRKLAVAENKGKGSASRRVSLDAAARKAFFGPIDVKSARASVVDVAERKASAASKRQAAKAGREALAREKETAKTRTRQLREKGAAKTSVRDLPVVILQRTFLDWTPCFAQP